ncbi:MAG: hypothetical protein KatS3mg111_0170 [Pirellulaceae bacterium]|nr:MAG: hypothetical protein KatS3mg111_0170 [Pirellulaceae bacterium]
MAKPILIDWQNDTLVLACSVGRERLGEVVLIPGGEGAEGADLASISSALLGAVETLKVGKSPVVVIAPREAMEMRTIQVPRIEPEELPDVIRFQAQRHFPQLNDSWSVDYLLLPDRPQDEMQTALVAALNPGFRQQVAAACERAQLELVHIVPRPLEIARYALHYGHIAPQGASVVVSLSDQAAEFVLLVDGRVVMVRGFRLPANGEGFGPALKSELNRTLIAAAPMLHGAPLHQAMLIAPAALQSSAQPVIAQRLEIPLHVEDPAALVGKVAGTTADQLVLHHGHRLTALAGASYLIADPPEVKIDFLHPKRRPPQRQNRRRIVLAAVAFLVILMGGLSWWYQETSRLAQELADLEAEIAAKEPLQKTAQEKVALLKEVDRFLKGSPNFLAELAYVAEKMPPPQQAIISAPTMSTSRDGLGVMAMKVLADSPATITRFEQALRDEFHDVRGSNYGELEEPAGEYRWQAAETITIKNRGWDLVDQLTGVKQVASSLPADGSPASPADQEQPAIAQQSAAGQRDQESRPVEAADETSLKSSSAGQVSPAAPSPAEAPPPVESPASSPQATEGSEGLSPPSSLPTDTPVPDENKRAAREEPAPDAAASAG